MYFFLAFAMVFSGILPVDALADEQELYVVSELIEYRDAYTKTFVMSDNTISSVTISQPIHFLDNETGEWEEIDNTLNTV